MFTVFQRGWRPGSGASERGFAREGSAGSEPAMEATKAAGEHDRYEQKPSAESEDMSSVEQAEAADAANEEVGDGKVEKAPCDVDCRGRQTLPRGFCERALERSARDSVGYMGYGVGEECAREEVRNVVVPGHVCSVVVAGAA